MFNKSISIARNTIKTSLFAGLTSLSITAPALAAGLDEATNAVNEIKTWGYGFLGAVVFVYLIYKVVMALMEKETWGDVLAGLGKVVLAGGIIAAGEWGWAIFGS